MLGKWVRGSVLILGLTWLAGADEGLWSVGLRTQGYYDFEPGNDWMSGPEIGYSNFNICAHRLQFRAAYLTSRLEQAFRPNILRQDYFLLSPTWHFSRNGFFDPIAQADLGYTRFDTEFKWAEDLDNSSWIAALQVGFALNLSQGAYGLYYHFGYNFITPESGNVYPGVFGLGLWVML
ncbi:MAG: hypothetical protein ABI036_16550 [Fibrobacteria bacterium]